MVLALVLALAATGGCAEAAPPGTDQLIVRYKASEAPAFGADPEHGKVLARQIISVAGMPIRHVRMIQPLTAVVALPRRMTEKDARVVAERIARHPKVEYAEPDAILTVKPMVQ